MDNEFHVDGGHGRDEAAQDDDDDDSDGYDKSNMLDKNRRDCFQFDRPCMLWSTADAAWVATAESAAWPGWRLCCCCCWRGFLRTGSESSAVASP